MKKRLFIVIIILFAGIFFSSCTSHTHEFLSEYDEKFHYEYCKKCNEIRNKKEHKFSSKETSATCTKEGNILYKCQDCDYEYSTTQPALGHEYVNGVCIHCGANEEENKNSITVYFDGNGGETLVRSILVPVNGTYNYLPLATKEGYNFLGWYTEKYDGDLVSLESMVTLEKSFTLYAHWEANKYIVGFDTNGADVLLSDVEVEFDTPYYDLPNISKVGYTFMGWYTAIEGGELVLSDDIVKTARNHTLYAHWNKNIYTIHLECDGVILNMDNLVIYYEDYYTDLPQISKEGYNFIGWYTAIEGGNLVTSETQKLTTNNETLYARFIPKSYIVYLDATMGTTEEKSITVLYGTCYENLPTLTSEGYIFDGWYTSFIGGEKITEEVIMNKTENHTLYAHWIGISYTITLDFNDDTSAESNIQVIYGSLYGILPIPVREGYIFNGWYTEKEKGELITEDSVVVIAENHTIYAHWIGIEENQ